MNWFIRNSTKIIKTVYILPILIAAGVSISHVIVWYGLTNPLSWAIYLSIGIEVAALSALAGITTKIGRGAYIPFFIVTFIQLIGNIFYAYQYIDINGEMFLDWVDLVGDLYGRGDIWFHRRVLAFIGGGLIPMISLSFLHLLVSFTNKEIDKDESKKDKSKKNELKKDELKANNEPEEVIISDDLFSPQEIYDDEGTNDEVLIDEEIGQLPDDKEFESDGVGTEINNEGANEGTNEGANLIKLIEEHKKDKKIEVDDIKEVKDRRNFSVNIPNRNNIIERIGSNKTLERGQSDKITYKKGNGN